MSTRRNILLGRNIRHLRRLGKLTQEKLAEKSKLSTTYIGYLEIGQKKPSLKTLERIASALEVKVKDLIPY